MIISAIIDGVEPGQLRGQKSTPILRETYPSVLLVDDDVAVCRILELILSEQHYRVQTSHSVADALAAIEQGFFDVFVIDYTLTDGSGLEVVERIQLTGRQAPVLLLSGYDRCSVAVGAAKFCIFDIIEKPFSSATITDAVKRAVASPKGVAAG